MGVVVEGFLAPEFEQVAQMFEASYEVAGREDNWENKERSQLCVFVGDTLVIDLYAKPDSYDTYNSDSLQVRIFNKNLYFLCYFFMKSVQNFKYDMEKMEYFQFCAILCQMAALGSKSFHLPTCKKM